MENKRPEKIVIALGGNALQSKDSRPTAEDQLEVVKKTCERIADISAKGYEIAIVHGNGPQVGRILLASETAKDITPAMPFDVCGAMSQGYIGYHIQQALKYALNTRNINIPVLTVATQMVVDASDPAFSRPDKPVGPFYTEAESKELIRTKGYQMAEAYTYLYSVENSLRLFIEKVAKEKYGYSYFSQLTIPRNLQRIIAERQKNDDANKWLSVRGTELFYLDFKDLGAVIDNNWSLFKDYFPSQSFILSKLNDMAECRNKIAHNSYVDDIERNLMKTYYNVILRQISDSEDK